MALGVVSTVRIAGLRPVHHIILTPGPAPRGAAAYGPYGSRSVGQAYNPYTGTYAATRQGSSPYGSWGQSVVSQGNRSAYAQHVSTANGNCWDRSRVQKAGPQLALRPSTGTPPWRRPPAVTCMPRTMATFIRTPVRVGTNTTMATGIRFRNSSKDAQDRAQSGAGAQAASGGTGNQAAAQQRAQNRQGFQDSARSQSQGGFNRAGSSGFGDVDEGFCRTATGANFEASALTVSKGAEAAGAVVSAEGDAALAADARV